MLKFIYGLEYGLVVERVFVVRSRELVFMKFWVLVLVFWRVMVLICSLGGGVLWVLGEVLCLWKGIVV